MQRKRSKKNLPATPDEFKPSLLEQCLFDVMKALRPASSDGKKMVLRAATELYAKPEGGTACVKTLPWTFESFGT